MESSNDEKAHSNFTSQKLTAEDLLKSQTSGLVTLSDFRKRRAEAFELREKEAQDASRGATPSSGVSTPNVRASTPQPPKKKKKVISRGKLSFSVDDDDGDDNSDSVRSTSGKAKKPTKTIDSTGNGSLQDASSEVDIDVAELDKPIISKHRILSKHAQAELREKLRKEFLAMQEAVKATEILVPFVFYDGSNVPGGVCRVKKGDHIWLMLDQSRKLGAELGLEGSDKSKNEWARVSVDDLMLVQNDIIIPHHYDLYYFLLNKSKAFNGPIFDYSDRPTAATPIVIADSKPSDEENLLTRPDTQVTSLVDASLLEGNDHDPSASKVVDRRWYERNKHIFPASTWEEFDPEKDYSKTFRKDTQGNNFFFP